MSLAIRGIGELVSWADEQPIRRDAGLVIDDGRVAWIGDSADLPAVDQVIEADGAAVIPGFVDSHTHLVFAGDRAEEFAARMAGRPYEAGGIRTTVAATRAAGVDGLAATTRVRLAELHAQGTTTVEMKSGYGLDVDTERTLLEVAEVLTSETTYLGAHVVPTGVDPDDYVSLVTGAMLEACAPHARWIDAFCERGAFDADQARTVLTAGMAVGLKPRLHANQLGFGPGAQLACELGAAAADHCTYLSDDDVTALADARVVAGLLPGVEFSTRHPYPDARRLLDAGVRIAIASDCNPGTSYTSSMAFCIALAVREMGLTPTEAVHAATQGGAWSLQRADVGHLRIGARADLVMLNAPSHLHLAYRPGVPLARGVWIGGVLV